MPAAPAARPDPFGLLCLMLAAIGWGSNWPPLKLVLAEVPPLTMRAGTGLFAAALLATLVRGLGHRLDVPRAVWPRLCLFSALNISAWMGFAALSLLWLDAGEACLIAYTAPAWTVLFAWGVLGDRPGPRHLLALLAGFGGLLLIVGAPGPDLTARLPGVAAGLAAAFCFACGTVLTKQRPLPLAPPVAVVWQVALGAVPMLAGALLFEAADLTTISPGTWGLLVYMAVVPLGLCYLAWFAALRRLPASVAAIGSLVGPLVGVGASAVILEEPFGVRQVAALGLVLGGVALVARR